MRGLDRGPERGVNRILESLAVALSEIAASSEFSVIVNIFLLPSLLTLLEFSADDQELRHSVSHAGPTEPIR